MSRPHPCPHHCPGGSGGLAALLVLVAVVALAAIARPVVHAAEVALEVILIATASVTGLVGIGGAVLLAHYAVRSHARNRRAVVVACPRGATPG